MMAAYLTGRHVPIEQISRERRLLAREGMTSPRIAEAQSLSRVLANSDPRETTPGGDRRRKSSA